MRRPLIRKSEVFIQRNEAVGLSHLEGRGVSQFRSEFCGKGVTVELPLDRQAARGSEVEAGHGRPGINTRDVRRDVALDRSDGESRAPKVAGLSPTGVDLPTDNRNHAQALELEVAEKTRKAQLSAVDKITEYAAFEVNRFRAGCRLSIVVLVMDCRRDRRMDAGRQQRADFEDFRCNGNRVRAMTLTSEPTHGKSRFREKGWVLK